MPNRMFDPVNNPFALQNMLEKAPDPFTILRDERTQSQFVVNRMGNEDKAGEVAPFKADRHGADEIQAEDESPVQAAIAELAEATQDDAEEGAADHNDDQSIDPVAEEVMAAAFAEEEIMDAPSAEAEVVIEEPELPDAPVEALAEPAEIAASAIDLPSEVVTSLMEAAREEAHALGHAAGFLEGQAQAKKELQQEQDKQMAMLRQLCEGVQTLADDADALFEPLKKLAMHLAEQLVRGELAQSGQAISRLVDNSLREMAAAGDKVVAVQLNPEDMEQYRPLAAQFSDSMILRSNTSLKRGSVRVSLDGSVVEDLIERRTEGLTKSLSQSASGTWRSGPGTSLSARRDTAEKNRHAIEDVTPIERKEKEETGITADQNNA
jgi:flagellar biosynthesis/type III secretory pathway protein FliH